MNNSIPFERYEDAQDTIDQLIQNGEATGIHDIRYNTPTSRYILTYERIENIEQAQPLRELRTTPVILPTFADI